MGVRYVWGKYFSPSGRFVEAWRGTMLCAIYKAYYGRVEDNVIKLYPYEVRRPGYIDVGKRTVPIREIYNE